MSALTIYRGRTNVIPVSLGFDVSADTITGEIRTKPEQTSDEIATWVIDNVTDGSDGEITLTLDDSITSVIAQDRGYTDLKRVTGGEPVPIFNEPLLVEFTDVVTA